VKIYLKLFANLRELHPTGNPDEPVELAEGTTIEQFIAQSKIPDPQAKIIFVNNVKAGRDQVLKDGDRLSIFPPLAGG
jgi:molybdopterin converting factor small subunit